jgi:molybdate transport repressor ModE-like protein
MAEQIRTRLDWEDVRFFAALARHGSLSAAARALGVNHATVARRLAELERALSARLFERRPDGYQLTEAGRIALEATGAMEEAAHALRRLEARDPLAGLVRITATPSLAEAFLVSRLRSLQERHPAIDVEIIAERRFMSLPRHAADLALRLGRPKDSELIGRRLLNIGFGFYATSEWRNRMAKGAAPVFVGFDEANADLPEALWLARCFPAARFCIRANSHMTQAIAARSGAGVALIPHFLGVNDAGLVPLPFPESAMTGGGIAGGLNRAGERKVRVGCVSGSERIPLERPPARELWLLLRRDARAAPHVTVARDFLIELFHRDRAMFEGG